MHRILLALCLLLAATGAWAVPPHALDIDLDMLSRLPHVEVTAKVHDSQPIRWSGVSLQSLLASRFALPSGEKLRGAWLATVVRLTAADGYQVVFTLPELDETFGHLEVLLADRQDGQPIAPSDGPIRVVVPSDKRAARSLRQLVRIEVLELKE